MKLSRSAPRAGFMPLKAVETARRSRTTLKMGCATKRTSMPRSASSASTESRRNGMSSLTISSTELAVRPLVLRERPVPVEADLGSSRLAHREQRPGVRGKLGELARVVAHEVFGRRIDKQGGQEIGGGVAMRTAQNLGSGRDQRRARALLIALGTIDNGHYRRPRRTRAIPVGGGWLNPPPRVRQGNNSFPSQYGVEP